MKIQILIFLILPLFLKGKEIFTVNTETNQIIDEQGRERYFHGLNIMFKIPPYIPDTKNWNIKTSLTEKDMKYIQSWGYNVVRLGVMWAGTAPKKDFIDQDYLNKMKNLTKQLASFGIYTLIDCHQDVFSEKFCKHSNLNTRWRRRSSLDPLRKIGKTFPNSSCEALKI
jgi:endoglycosylceramidase